MRKPNHTVPGTKRTADRPPKWKQWLSYFVEFHLESAPSDYNPHLYVALRQGRYQLCSENAVYSYGDLYSNFFDAFQTLDIQQLPIRNVLILGLGLGSIPLMLERNFKRNYEYTAVEIDDSVIYLAQKYVLHELESPITCIQADAFHYVQQATETYDLVCMDIFLDDLIPTKFASPTFLKNLQQLIKPNGLLLYNRLSLTPDDREQTLDFYRKHFKEVFPRATYLDVQTNFMLINRNDLFHS